AGNDILSGRDGATTFYVDANDAGQDRIEDTGGISPQTFANWYYKQLGITAPQYIIAYSGMWGVIGDTGFTIDRFYTGPNYLFYQPLGQIDHSYTEYGSDGFGVVYDNLKDL